MVKILTGDCREAGELNRHGGDRKSKSRTGILKTEDM